MARDIIHNEVRTSLENDNWTITHDPYSLYLETRTLSIDLGGEKIIGAEKGPEKIAVEIKSFLKESFIYDFYEAFGQYLVYEDFLAEQDPERTLYLAVTEEVFAKKFVNDNDVLRICRKYKVKILIIDAQNQIIEQWIR
jgi:hypothetical protein